MDDARSEWSQHGSRGVVPTEGKRGLMSAIPVHFPYFHVEFGMDRGLCLVLEGEKRVGRDWGRGVLEGVIRGEEDDSGDEEGELGGLGGGVGRRGWSYERQMEEVREFQKMWEPFDWTKLL